MVTDIEFLINFFNKHTRSGFKDEMGEQEAEAPAAGGGGGGRAGGRRCAARGGRGHHGFFSGLHALQQGQLAGLVEIHAHTQIDFGGVGIGIELFVQTQDRVARGHFDGGEKRHEEVLKQLRNGAPAFTRGQGKSSRPF